MNAWERRAFRKVKEPDHLGQGQQKITGAQPRDEREHVQRDPEKNTVKNAIIFAVKHLFVSLSASTTLVSAIWFHQKFVTTTLMLIY
jgi:hypothetical protein